MGNADRYELAAEALAVSAKRIGVKVKPEEANAFIHAAVKGARDEAKLYGVGV